MMYPVILLAILLTAPFISRGTENCTNPFPDEFTDSSLQYLPKHEDIGIQILVPDITFDCYGHVTKWKMNVTVINAQPHIMHFQIWRPFGAGRFKLISDVPITQQLSQGDTYLSQGNDDDAQVKFEPGDVFGFLMPIKERAGSTPSFRQYYSTNFTTGPSNTLYYLNVNGTYPSCVISLCDPAIQVLAGVQLQILSSIMVDDKNHSDSLESDLLCDPLGEIPSECVATPTVTPTASVVPILSCEDMECGVALEIILASAAAALVLLLLLAVSVIIVTVLLCTSSSKHAWKRKSQAVHGTIEHYSASNGSLYAIPHSSPKSSIHSIVQGQTLDSETPDGRGPIAMNTISRKSSMAVPYSDPVQTGVAAIHNQPGIVSDRERSFTISIIRNHPDLLAYPSSAVPYMDPVSIPRRATLPSRPPTKRPFQPQRPSSSKARPMPSMGGSSVELANSFVGKSVTARQEVMPYALSSVMTLNISGEEGANIPATYMEPSCMTLDHGTPAAAFPYCEPSRLMLDRIPLENPPGFPCADLSSSSANAEPNQAQVDLPYQDPTICYNANRSEARQQSLQPLPNPYMEPSPTIRPKRKHGIQEYQCLVADSVPVHSPQEVFHPAASSTQKKLHRNFKLEKQHSLGPPNPYMEPSPTIKTKRNHALSESQTPVTNSSFIYIPPEVLSRMRETSMGQKTQSAEEEVLHVPGFELRKYLQEEEIYSKLARSQVPAVFEQKDMFWEPQNSSAELYNQLADHKYREIHRRQIGITNCIGSGHFGTVHKGVWQISGSKLEVAVKTLKPDAPEKEKVSFLREAAIMGQFLHPNVIKLHGVVTVGEPLMIVLELMTNGDLKCFVNLQKRKMPNVNHLELSRLFVKFCRHIACGMNYLARKEFVHRDLAARNILLTDDLICKVGDFGMARDVSNDDIYESQGGMIPLKWTAPEAVNYRQFSSDSDVWSYGMVLYEMWSLGHKPFEGMENKEIVSLVSSGYCQPPPPGCPRNVYNLMVQCWHPNPKSRPAFSKVMEYLNMEDEVLLNWSSKDAEVSSMVTELGAPLSEGLQLYPDLQMSYDVLSPK